jgi:resuscitation-promoting factor RpfB
MVLALASGRPGRIAAQAAVLTAVIGASVLYSQINKTVTLSVDGKATEVHALSGTVGDLLEDQGVTVGPRDIVAPAASSSLGEGDTVVVRYARPLTITVDGQKRVYWTTETSVDKALAAVGVRSDGATMSASRSQRIDRAGLTFWLSTPKQVRLVADGRTSKLTTAAPTVGALLTAQHIAVKPLDRLNKVPSAAISDGLTIRLTRVTQKRVTKTENVTFGTRRVKTSKLYRGETKVITKGVSGKRSAVYDLTLENGKVKQRELVSADVTKKPTTQVVQVGTKSKPSSSSGGGGTPSGGGLNWAALAKCESGGNPRAVNSSGGYYGLYQFSLSTWRAQGGSGNPIDASSAEQTKRAQILYGKTGASSWPSCGSRLFS